MAEIIFPRVNVMIEDLWAIERLTDAINEEEDKKQRMLLIVFIIITIRDAILENPSHPSDSDQAPILISCGHNPQS